MKISELIHELQEAIVEFGDLEVKIFHAVDYGREIEFHRIEGELEISTPDGFCG